MIRGRPALAGARVCVVGADQKKCGLWDENDPVGDNTLVLLLLFYK